MTSNEFPSEDETLPNIKDTNFKLVDTKKKLNQKNFGDRGKSLPANVNGMNIL